ncbi:MAG: hypothetical protein ACTSUP_06015 [Candidatus Heimdallarchaeaceae archaeon]
MSQMSINSLKNNLTNPARSYLWEVLFANPLGGDTETLLLRCRSTNIPGVSLGSILLPYKQTGGVKYPGKKTFSHTWSATFVEGEDRAMWDAFYEWTQSIVNAETGLGSFNIKTDIYLHLINTDGTVSKKIKLVGCYIESQEDIAITNDTDAEINIAVTFSYDYWIEG